MRYLPLTPEDRAEMLGVIGVDSIDALFVDAPAGTLLDAPVDLPAHASEIEVRRTLDVLANQNRAAGAGPFFCGAGAYRHAIPASLPVYLDSPMAIHTTELFQHHLGEHRLDAAQCRAMATRPSPANCKCPSRRTACGPCSTLEWALRTVDQPLLTHHAAA